MSLDPSIETLAFTMLGSDDASCHDFVSMGAAAKSLSDMGIPSKVMMCSLNLNPDEPRRASNLSFLCALQVQDVILAGPGRYGWNEAAINELRDHGLADDHKFQLLEKPTHMNWMMILNMLDDEQKEQMKQSLARCASAKQSAQVPQVRLAGMTL
jgi:hypothetical protein